MPVTHRLQCQVWFDSTLPRDSMTINPVFQHTGAIVDMDGFCNTMATYLDGAITGHPQIQVKSYDVEGTKPIFPDGEKMLNVGAAPASSVPREMALCLSFYADRNAPRHRGRLYIPLQWIATKTTDVRPSSAQLPLVREFALGFSAMGGSDVDWGIWSEADGQFRKAQYAYVDNEWDTVRRRGLKPVTRAQGSVSG